MLGFGNSRTARIGGSLQFGTQSHDFLILERIDIGNIGPQLGDCPIPVVKRIPVRRCQRFAFSLMGSVIRRCAKGRGQRCDIVKLGSSLLDPCNCAGKAFVFHALCIAGKRFPASL